MTDINDQDISGNTLLHTAIHVFDLGTVQDCLQQGADITIKNNSKQTPLHFAVSRQEWTVTPHDKENIYKIIELLKEKSDV